MKQGKEEHEENRGKKPGAMIPYSSIHRVVRKGPGAKNSETVVPGRNTKTIQVFVKLRGR